MGHAVKPPSKAAATGLHAAAKVHRDTSGYSTPRYPWYAAHSFGGRNARNHTNDDVHGKRNAESRFRSKIVAKFERGGRRSQCTAEDREGKKIYPLAAEHDTKLRQTFKGTGRFWQTPLSYYTLNHISNGVWIIQSSRHREIMRVLKETLLIAV